MKTHHVSVLVFVGRGFSGMTRPDDTIRYGQRSKGTIRTATERDRYHLSAKVGDKPLCPVIATDAASIADQPIVVPHASDGTGPYRARAPGAVWSSEFVAAVPGNCQITDRDRSNPTACCVVSLFCLNKANTQPGHVDVPLFEGGTGGTLTAISLFRVGAFSPHGNVVSIHQESSNRDPNTYRQ